ncbi:hypothetical protein ANTPLA_LOCUS1109 [Anthophora plagiata]
MLCNVASPIEISFVRYTWRWSGKEMSLDIVDSLYVLNDDKSSSDAEGIVLLGCDDVIDVRIGLISPITSSSTSSSEIFKKIETEFVRNSCLPTANSSFFRELIFKRTRSGNGKCRKASNRYAVKN